MRCTHAVLLSLALLSLPSVAWAQTPQVGSLYPQQAVVRSYDAPELEVGQVAEPRAEPTVKERQISQVVKAVMPDHNHIQDQAVEQAAPQHCS